MCKKKRHPQSNKAKGRKGQQDVRDMLLGLFEELEFDDIRSTSMGASGADLLLSPAAKRLFPYEVEVKRKKKIGAARFMEQAKEHGGLEPVAFFREDRGVWYTVLTAEHFLDMIKTLHKK